MFRLIAKILIQIPRTQDRRFFQILWPFYQVFYRKEVSRVHRHLAQSDLQPKPSTEQVYASLFMNGMDSLRYLLRVPQMLDRVHMVNRSLLQNLLDQNKPVVVVSIHCGAFEMIHRALTRFNRPVNLMTSQHLHPTLETFLASTRNTQNLKIHKPDDAPHLLKELIRKNRMVAIMVDQSRHGKGNAIDFLGRPNDFWLKFPLEANKAGATIVTVRAIRRGLEHVIEFENAYDPGMDLRLLVRQLGMEFESWVRQNPEQWTWNYPRLWTTKD